MVAIFDYDHPVNVSAESGELLGPGHFVGGSSFYRLTVMPGWSGELHTNIDSLVLVESGQLRLEFDNGVVGHALCTNATINASSGRGVLFRVKLAGVGGPPTVG